jgi:hypothetical protein
VQVTWPCRPARQRNVERFGVETSFQRLPAQRLNACLVRRFQGLFDRVGRLANQGAIVEGQRTQPPKDGRQCALLAQVGLAPGVQGLRVGGCLQTLLGLVPQDGQLVANLAHRLFHTVPSLQNCRRNRRSFP